MMEKPKYVSDWDDTPLTYYFNEVGGHSKLTPELQAKWFVRLDELSPLRIIINRKKNRDKYPMPDDIPKPHHCKCGYPDEIVGMSGHAIHCPIHVECTKIVGKIAAHTVGITHGTGGTSETFVKATLELCEDCHALELKLQVQ